MEFTYSWFLAAKFLAFAVPMATAYWFYHHKFTKVALWIAVPTLVFTIWAPIKYDFTGTKQVNTQRVTEISAAHTEVVETITTVLPVKKTFAEAIAEEQLRSTRLNNTIQEDLK